MSFDTLGLTPELLRAVAAEGYTEPTPVQREAIPLVLDGRDVLAGAQTGTGKTAAFVLPMLQLLHSRRPAGSPNGAPDRRDATRSPVRALILTPTRELALQVEESVRTYGAARPIRSTTIYGGVGFDPQVRAIRAGAEIVVATPGRLLDHLTQRTIDLSRVEILVLDEADRMLDMGFIRDIRKILAVLPPRRQNLLFSATFSDEIRRLADGFLDRPAFVQVTPKNTATELVTQVAHPVDRERKRELLSFLITSGRIDQALVFTRTKHGANRLALQLEKDGIKATAIHGNKSQPQRVRALADFKAGRYAVLVATEIAARGLDIDALPHVVNFELPMVPEDYVHRIGRTGRAERDGDAVSLVCVDEMKLLAEIEKVLGRRIPTEVIAGFEPDPRIRPEPILRGGLGTSRPQSSPRGRSGAHAPRQGAPRTDHGPHVGPPAHRGGGSGYAAPRRPGQGLGNGMQQPTQGRPAQAPNGARSGAGRPAQRPIGASGPSYGSRPAPTHGRPNPSHGQGNQRPAAPGKVMPGERIARQSGGR